MHLLGLAEEHLGQALDPRLAVSIIEYIDGVGSEPALRGVDNDPIPGASVGSMLSPMIG